jgi:hypothetical protein
MPVSTEDTVEDGLGGRDQRRARVVAHLPFGDQQHERLALSVASGTQLEVQTFGSSEAARSSPFSSRLAAVDATGHAPLVDAWQSARAREERLDPAHLGAGQQKQIGHRGTSEPARITTDRAE